MLSNKLAVGVLAILALVGAAGAGAFLASSRQAAPAATERPSASRPAATPAGGNAVEATEAVIDDKPSGGASSSESVAPAVPEPAPAPAPAPARTQRPKREASPVATRTPSAPRSSQSARTEAPTGARSQSDAHSSRTADSPADRSSHESEPGSIRADRPATPIEPVAPIAPPQPQYLEVTVPADSVMGLQFETSLSSETAHVEERVEARVTRDVRADGRVAIPAGSRVVGSVSLVERGGRVKEQARLGVRFHTVVLADGTELPLQTETIYRVGESPGNSSAAKMGGGAIGGAILGAILGGGKGAAIGGAVGAAGGTAAVMASGRKPATISAGSPVTVKVLSPVTVTVEKE
jgi:type IV secretory pathway VirB10-like protein